jgi:dTDP-4-amino-4,6-dideoxygalactose transaminase
MGLQVLEHLPTIINRRREIDGRYRTRLRTIPGIRVPELPPSDVDYNFAYFPVEIEAAEFGMSRDELYTALKGYNVFTRRYFYPLLTDFSCYRHLTVVDPLEVARGVAERILTLPIYDSLALEDVDRICDIISHLHGRAQPKPMATQVAIA